MPWLDLVHRAHECAMAIRRQRLHLRAVLGVDRLQRRQFAPFASLSASSCIGHCKNS
jgi:hypothetical protein